MSVEVASEWPTFCHKQTGSMPPRLRNAMSMGDVSASQDQARPSQSLLMTTGYVPRRVLVHSISDYRPGAALRLSCTAVMRARNIL